MSGDTTNYKGPEAATKNSLLARLKTRLDYILHNNSCFELIYVGARIDGKLVFKRWIPINDYVEYLTVLQSMPDGVTSIELDCLYEPAERNIHLTKGSLNSYRGKYGFSIFLSGKLHKFSALHMIAMNLSFPAAVERVFVSQKMDVPNECLITLYKSEQYLFTSNTQSGEYYSLYRGNRVYPIEDVSAASVRESISLMTSWLAGRINSNGRAEYKYWPSKDEFSSANNAIRQWMATVCLGRAARTYNSDSLQDVANRNLAHNIRSMLFERDNLGYIFLDGSAKLGAAALAALAILESKDRNKYLKQEYALRNLIEHLSNSDGSFDTYYIPRDGTGNENFYSGETLLFQAQEYSISKNPALLDKIMRSFRYYREWHRANRNPAFIPWHTQAYLLVWRVTRSPELADFIFEMNDWLLSMQQWDSAEFLDMQGRFYDPARPYFGPPHASSTGVYLEGLIDAFALARELGDQLRAENYRIAIVRGIRSLMQLQYKDTVDCFYIKHLNRVLGGVRTTVYDNTIRIDNVQHGLMALLKIANRFSLDDYSLPEKKRDFNAVNNMPVQQRNFKSIVDSVKPKILATGQILCFKLKDFKVDICAMRRDFEDNIRDIPATSYHHADIPYEGWAITSRDGSASDGVKRISTAERTLNGIKVENSTMPTEICTAFLKEVLKELESLGLDCFRARYMKMGSGDFQMKFHRDAKFESWRLHIPLFTNEHCFFEWKTIGGREIKKHFPADGSAYLVRVDELHRGINSSPDDIERIHFLLSLKSAPGTHLIDSMLVERVNDD